MILRCFVLRKVFKRRYPFNRDSKMDRAAHKSVEATVTMTFNIDTPDRREAVRFNRHLRRAHNSRGAFSTFERRFDRGNSNSTMTKFARCVIYLHLSSTTPSTLVQSCKSLSSVTSGLSIRYMTFAVLK